MPPRAPRLALLVALAALPAAGRGQGVAVMGGDVDLTIPVVGTGFGTATDASTRLTWVGDANDRTKITVETVAAAQAFDLAVEAVSVVGGKGEGLIPLTAGMWPQDLVTRIKKGHPRRGPASGSAQLRYEASVPSGAPPPGGVDVHTVLFTLTAQ